MICNKCGAVVNDNQKFCASCGSPVEVQSCQQPQTTVNQQNWVDSSLNESDTATPQRGKKKLAIGIIAAVLAVVLIFWGAASTVKALFGSNGPLMTLKSAIQNSAEQGFTFTATVTDNDEKISLKGATVGFDPDEMVIPESFVKFEDEIYYIDDECIYSQYSANRGEVYNLKFDGDDDEAKTYKLFKQMLTDDAMELYNNGNLREVAQYINCIGHGKILDEKGFEKCATALLKKLNDKDYLEENFGYTQKKKSGKTTMTFEFDVKDVFKLAVKEFKECEDAFVWEQDFKAALDELEKEYKNFDDDITVEAEFVIEDDCLISFYVNVTEKRSTKTYTYGMSGELDNFEEAEIDADVRKAVSTAKRYLGKHDEIAFENGNFYDKSGNKLN